MIESARKAYAKWQFQVADIAAWTAEADLPDVVFSNAALQWVPDHAALFPRLLKQVASGGALAVQVPANLHAPAHQLMRELAASAKWRDRLPAHGVREWNVHEPSFYFDALAPHAARLDLWTTEYIQVMPSAEAILDWYRGTGLRPFLDALGSDVERAHFADDYLASIRAAYPQQPNGQVLLPFRRLFVIAYRS
jgi:trans-aconitate 2-methyltransferase